MCLPRFFRQVPELFQSGGDPVVFFFKADVKFDREAFRHR